MKVFILALSILLTQTTSALSCGSCSYRAHKHCFQPKANSVPSHLMIRAYCSLQGTVSEGVFDSDNF